jgi:hypothetical protein
MYSWKFQYQLIRATQNFQDKLKVFMENIILSGFLCMQNFTDKFP